MYTCVYLHKNRAITISLEKKENELAATGDHILESKTPRNIVYPQYATQHAAETLGAAVALHTFGSSDSALTSVLFGVLTTKAAPAELGCLLGLRGASPASKVQMELHILKEKVLLKKNAPVMDPVWTKERWTNSKT